MRRRHPAPVTKKTVYKVVFLNEGKVYEIYARSVGQSNLMGFVDYKLYPGVIAFLHAETLPDYRGRGVAGEIATKSLDDARALGLRVKPACPFYQEFLEEHPEYADLTKRAGE